METDFSTCDECGDEMSEEELSYVALYGQWNSDTDWFDRVPQARPVCRSCWNEEYNRVAGAYYRVSDPEKLWNVLEASDGDLVADMKYNVVGGRPFARVSKNSELSVVMTTLSRDEDGIFASTEMVDVDDEWLDEMLEHEPNLAIIRPVEETPFTEVLEEPGPDATNN